MCWSYWILGVGFCGAYRTDFLSPRQEKKTWYLNYALYGLFDASFDSFAACTLNSIGANGR